MKNLQLAFMLLQLEFMRLGLWMLLFICQKVIKNNSGDLEDYYGLEERVDEFIDVSTEFKNGLEEIKNTLEEK